MSSMLTVIEISELVRKIHDEELLKHDHMSWLDGGVSSSCPSCTLLVKCDVIEVKDVN